jgi:16S rRNA (uracil1498-N3)-methyltransferase
LSPADHPGPMVFVADLEAPTLADGDRHHLERALRLRAGDPLTLADGHGGWRPARLGSEPEPTGPVVVEPPSHPPLTIGFALVKLHKPELAVQKLTELGIDRIVPFRAERSVVRWDDDQAAKAVARLRSVARAAAQQSHRARMPLVEGVVTLGDIAADPEAVMADRGGDPPSLQRTTVLVGPEGGWSPEERSLLVPRMALGPHVLRAETAAVTAGALMAALRSGLVGPLT